MKEGLPKRTDGKEKHAPKTLKRGALAALALYAFPPSDTVQSDLSRFEMRSVAAQQLKEQGITDAQRTAYKPGLSEAMAKGIDPFEYSSGTLGEQDLIADISRIASTARERFNTPTPELEEAKKEELREGYFKRSPYKEEYAEDIVQARSDAWRLYLGLPQEHGTFDISEFRPDKGSDDTYYYSLKHFLDNKAKRHISRDAAIRQLVSDAENPHEDKDTFVGVMGRYTLTLGQDERGHYISYYDKWDLDRSVEGDQGILGKPFEIYDRIYYNPETFEELRP